MVELPKIKDLQTHIQISAQKIGITYLKIAKKNRSLKVISKKNYQTYKRLSQLTQKMRGLSVEINDHHQVSLGGTLLRWQDWNLIANKLQCSLPFSFNPQIPNHLKQEVSKEISQLLQQRNLPTVDVQFLPKVQIFIPKSLKPLKKNYQDIFACYGLKVSFSAHLVATPPMVATEIIIAEVKNQT